MSNVHAKVLTLAGLLASLSFAATATPLAYVTSEKGGVAVVDLDSLEVLRNLDIGGSAPRGLGLTADGKLLVTANKGTSDISVIDTATGKVVRRVNVGKNVEFVRVRGKLAYVTYEPGASGGPGPGGGPPGQSGGPGEARKDGPPAGSDKPGGKAAGAAGGKAGGHAGGKDDDDDQVPAEIAVIDLEQGKLIRSMQSGRETEGVEFSSDGKLLLVANEGDNSVSVYQRDSGALLHKIDLSGEGLRPRGIKASPDGTRYAVTLESSNRLVLIDSSYRIVGSVATRTGPYGVSFDPAGKRIYVAASRDAVIQVFDADGLALLGEIPVGARCWHFTLDQDGSRLIAACGRSDNLLVASTETFKVIKTVPGVLAPWGIVTFPASFGSIDSP